MFHETLTAPVQMPPNTNDEVPDSSPSHQSHANVESLPESCPLCNIFYTDFIVLSGAAAEALERKTRGTTNTLWLQSRQLRVTASNIKRVPKKAETPHTKAVASLTTTTFRGNAATRRGQQFEPVARVQFMRETGLAVSLCGTVVCPELPWLSATPDGVIESHDAILEIKCPNTDDCQALIAQGGYEVKLKNGTFSLDAQHDKGYYSQVQYTMLCTKKALCFFYVWSVNSTALFRVPFDEHFITLNTPRLTRFYFCSMLPHLEEKYRSGSLKLCKDYRQLTKV